MNDFVKRFEELIRNESQLLLTIDSLKEDKSRLRDELIDIKGDLSYKREQYDVLEARFADLSRRFSELDKAYQEKIKALKVEVLISPPLESINPECIQVEDSELLEDKHDYYDFWEIYEDPNNFGERF